MPKARYTLFAKQIFRQKNAFQGNQWTNNEQPSTHYSFIRHSLQTKTVSLQVDEYFFWVLSRNRLTGEAATKCLRRKIDSPKWRITVYTLFAFRLLFVVSLVFRRYSQIVYSGLKYIVSRNIMNEDGRSFVMHSLIDQLTEHTGCRKFNFALVTFFSCNHATYICLQRSFLIIIIVIGLFHKR